MVNDKTVTESIAFNRALKLMGNRFEITVVADDEDWANECIEAGIAEIRRIEKLLTTFSDDSETSLINKNAGIEPVAVSAETFNLIERSVRISKITQGAFDITYGSVDKHLWNFDVNMKSLPDKETAHKLVRLINYRNIILDAENLTVFLKEVGMRTGFGGIGKGYAAENDNEMETAVKIIGLKKFYLSGMAGVGLDYNFYKNLSADFSPTFRFALNPINRGIPVKSFPNSFGFSMGLKLKL